jgi:hypothetical protein
MKINDRARLETVPDHRSIPLETLREFALEESERSSLREAASAAGLGHSTLHKFVRRGTSPLPRVRRLLALWYLRERREDRAAVEAFAGATELLVGAMPEDVREDARQELLEFVEQLYPRHGVSAPDALLALRTPARNLDPPALAERLADALITWARDERAARGG